jgi:hypothetical protein
MCLDETYARYCNYGVHVCVGVFQLTFGITVVKCWGGQSALVMHVLKTMYDYEDSMDDIQTFLGW